MRTSINIDDQIYLETKKLAAESKKTLASVIEDALRSALAKKIQKRVLFR
ncbi:MAG: hypothetical protein QNK20_11665 [Aureibaculum sp.]|nr:hypothetical protein [Aureibaculum sp.]